MGPGIIKKEIMAVDGGHKNARECTNTVGKSVNPFHTYLDMKILVKQP